MPLYDYIKTDSINQVFISIMSSKVEVTTSKRMDSIHDLTHKGYCYYCLCSDIVLAHNPPWMHFFCLECQENENGALHSILHPKCMKDEFFCSKCEKVEKFGKHVHCNERRRNFINDLQERGHCVIRSAPFKSFKK